MASADVLSSVHARQWLPELARRLVDDQPQVLITVVHTQGSTPRDAGARMWVGTDFTVSTIGGGHLEWKAIASARVMLDKAESHCRITRYPLGPALGQCCGGVVWLLFEYLDSDDASWCIQIATTLARGGSVTRRMSLLPRAESTARTLHFSLDILVQLNHGVPRCSRDIDLQYPGHDDPSSPVTHLDIDTATVADVWAAPAVHVVVCGAGHIGTAIIRLLADLPVQVTWLDPRDGCWPSSIPANVQVVQGDADDVPDMPENAYWLVLTHNHAVDLAIIDAVFRHKTFMFMGLIGSRTKKARFVSHLSRRHGPELVARICCPVGMVHTSSKLPSVIAVSVVAQLLGLMAA